MRIVGLFLVMAGFEGVGMWMQSVGSFQSMFTWQSWGCWGVGVIGLMMWRYGGGEDE